MRDQIVLLIEKYNTVKQLYSSELSAFLFYKDLIALHPITDGNGRGCRALLSYLLLSEGIPSPSFERISMADLYVTGPESVQFLEMGVWRGWQSINFGGPPKN
jgi:fido (protein-threonine AMPylation protein)